MSHEGKHLRKTLDLISEGSHSDGFHAPVAEPHIWPTRTHTGRSAVRSAAMIHSCSATHFDSGYPEPTTGTGSIGASRISVERSNPRRKLRTGSI